MMNPHLKCFDEDKNIYKIPSLALKLGHTLKKLFLSTKQNVRFGQQGIS